MKRTAAVWSVVLLLAGPVWGGDPQPQDHQPDHEQLVNRLGLDPTRRVAMKQELD